MDISMETGNGSQVLASVLEGDLQAFVVLSKQGHSKIQEYAAQLGELLLLPYSVQTVILALQQGHVEPDLVQQWASFVRRGYISNKNGSAVTSLQPLKPIDIIYYAPAEDKIVAALARLDEIGDTIDGEISDDELTSLLFGLY